jgi:hypothetical protein
LQWTNKWPFLKYFEKKISIVNNLWKNILFLRGQFSFYMVFKGSAALFFALLACEVTYSQSISHQVLVPAAAVVLKSSINYAQTVGEPIVEIVAADDKVLTQGFQQKRVVKERIFNPGTGAKSYPNPANEYVKVEVWSEQARDLRISIINFQGALLYDIERKFSGPYQEIIEIDVSDYKRGMYFIRVTSKDNAIYRTFKFEKM